jgi:hypothetical protein
MFKKIITLLLFLSFASFAFGAETATNKTTIINTPVPVSLTDGAHVTLGAKADNRSSATDTTAITAMQILKQISYMLQNPASRAVTNAGTFATQASLISGQANISGNAGIVGAAVPRVVQAYNSDWVSLRANYTSAQTNTSIITAAAGEKIVVKNISVMASNANTVNTSVLIGFDDTTTPTGADCIFAHPGIAAGSGAVEFYGSDGIVCPTAADDLKITSSAPTTGSIDVVVITK